MPELAEVETVRRHLDRALKGQRIKEISFDPQDHYLFEFVSHANFQKALVGAKIIGTGRKGKYFWLELNRKPWPIFHLGMNGNISLLHEKSNGMHEKVWGGESLSSKNGVADDKEMTVNQKAAAKAGGKMKTIAAAKSARSRATASATIPVDKQLFFSRLLVSFGEKLEMSFSDPRRFGRLWLSDDPWTHPRIAKLGFDPLIDFPTPKELHTKLARRKKAIKAVLLDQSLFAGVGNWLADEILFQARMSPHRIAADLSLANVKKLHAQVLKVIKFAVKVDADYGRFPKTWLFHDRWGKVKDSKTSRGAIIHEEVGGRTTAWVPTWQK